MSRAEVDFATYNALLADLYAQARGPGGWRTAMQLLQDFVGAASCTVQFRSKDFTQVQAMGTTAATDPAAAKHYVQHFAQGDPWISAWLRRGRPSVFHGLALRDGEPVTETEFYRDYGRKWGLFDMVGAQIDLPGGDAIVSLHRSEDMPAFDANTQHLLEALLPHLRNVMATAQLTASLQTRRDAAEQALGRLGIGLVVLDASGGVIEADAEGERLLRDGTALTVADGKLRLRASEWQAAFTEMLRRAASRAEAQAPPEALILPRPDMAPLSVLVAPLVAPAGFWQRAKVAAYVFDPTRRRRPALAAFAALHCLTPAETRLLEALMQDERVGDYAARTELSVNTVNTHLRHMFAKTQTGRQAELVAQVLRDLALHMAGGAS